MEVKGFAQGPMAKKRQSLGSAQASAYPLPWSQIIMAVVWQKTLLIFNGPSVVLWRTRNFRIREKMLVPMVLIACISPLKGDCGPRNTSYKDQVWRLAYVLVLKPHVWLEPAGLAWGGLLKARGPRRQGHRIWQPLPWPHTALWHWWTQALSHTWSCLMLTGFLEMGQRSPGLWCHSLYWNVCSKRYPHMSWWCSEAIWTCSPHPHTGVGDDDPTSYASIRVCYHVCLLSSLGCELLGVGPPHVVFIFHVHRVPSAGWMPSK